MDKIYQLLFILIAKINSFISNLVEQYHLYLGQPRYAILKLIPHQRVVTKNNDQDEIFDLYKLGIFTAKNSFLTNLCTVETIEKEIVETVELVEFQAEFKYKPHYHKKSSAIIYIILGSGVLHLGETCLPYKAGTRVKIPAGTLHGFNTTTRTLFLSIQSPPILNAVTGYLDLYYEKDSDDEA